MTRLFFLFVMPAMLCCQKAVRAQPELPPVFHLTERDGLGSRYASSLVEDKQRGYIWIGTHSGIWRYDGETLIKVYPQKSAGGPSADTYLAITLLLADSKGDVWFFDDTKCVKRLSPITGEAETYYVRVPGQDSTVVFYPIFYMGGMHEDKKGRIWANTESHGLVLFDKKMKCFVPARMSVPLELNGIRAKIFEDDEGWFWFANGTKPVRYNPETGEVWFKKNNPKNWPIFDLTSAVLFIDSRQTMWLAELGHGYKYDLKTHHFEEIPELYSASGFVEDSLGRVWLGRYYERGLTRYDPLADKFTQYPPNENDPSSLHISQWAAWLHLDKRGMLWVLDVQNINAFAPAKPQPFQIFKEDLSKGAKSLPLGQVSDVFPASDGRYYISYWTKNGGVVVLDTNFQVEEKWSWSNQEFDNHRNAFWNSVEDNEGNIWMARQKGWFLVYNIKRRSLRTLYCPEFEGTSAQRAMKDSQGNLWWGLWRGKGITKWDCRTRKFTNYPVVPAGHGMVYNIVEDGPDLLWLSTETGIVKFDRKTGQCRNNYLPPTDDATHRLREVVVGLVKTNDSTLIGTCLAGIFEFNLRTERFNLPFPANEQKMPRTSADMVMDANGYIYYGYLGGMVRFHPTTKEWTVVPLTEMVGFPFPTRFFPNPLPNRRLAFAANDRFVILDIAALENEVPVPVPKVTLFMVDGDTTALGRNLEKPIRLQHNENYFSLHFSNFAQPDQAIYYSYRLKGLQNEWSQPSPTPNARFTNVPPGEYTFELRAQLANGTPTEVSAFPFEILPPFWQTWWFRLLAVAAVAVLIRLIFRYRLRQQLEKEAIRLRIARDLHDEVGSTLTTISILSESVLRQMELDGEKARLSGIGDKARTAMSSMSDIVWSVNPQNDSMDKIVERMIRFATDTLEPMGISAIFDIEKEVYALQIPMEQRKDFYLFFKEATTNVAKHSGATRAVFSLKKTGRQLHFTIEDDGKGLPPQPQGSLGGNGWHNMRARAAALGAQLEIKTGENRGVRVSLRMPTA